jgi:L-fuculose-phosphate aldolase
LAVENESLCKQYVITRQVGNPVILGEDEMAIVLGKFRNYRKQPDEINSLSIPAVEAPERRF